MAPALAALLKVLVTPEAMGALGSAAIGTAKAAVRFVTDIKDGVDGEKAMARFDAGADHWNRSDESWTQAYLEKAARDAPKEDPK